MGRYQDLVAESARRARPLSVALELTHRCNYACRHCYLPDHAAAGTVPTERLLRLLEELVEMGTLRLSLTGGEALLHPDWLRVARRARELGFALSLLTNGSLVTDEVAGELAALDASVNVSLYSTDRAAFEAVTGVEGSFARTMAGIERLRARGVEVVLKVPLLRSTATGLPDVLECASSLGATCLASPLVTTRTDGDREPLSERLTGAELRAHYAGPHARFPLPDECRPPDEDGPLCAAGSRLAVVSPGGDVLACLMLTRPAGNVLEKPFREIWETSPWLRSLRSLRRRHLRVCDTCARLAYCARCPARALVEDGDLLGPSRWSCERAAAVEEAARGRSG